ncbi:MAG: bifunctional adenosylcobinamide kinase/adenosylcobinamide-phosphate guanylyltransferase [Chloroflexi bacterium]|nr:MAG: bifunctional adenosylcobinamide kinase/adenosylcobinamide-phosphate guanylyltransferase [Chloroflexota bacterium]
MSENQTASSSTRQTVPPRLIVILGGARSGKSAFAERLAANSGRSVAFIATATAGDDEMRERIARHRASRPKGWHTLEEPLDLARAVHRAVELADVLLLDCVTLWLGNVLLRESGRREKDEEAEVEFHTTGGLFDEVALKEIEALLSAVKLLGPNKTLIVVTNEVGLGIVPAYPLGRLYRDTLGYVNQRLAQAADRVYLMVAGMAVDIKRLHEEASL